MTTEKLFPMFISELANYMKSYNLVRSDIAYVNISKDYWMPAEEFFELDTAPKIWQNFSKNGMGTWDIYSSKFQVVMKNWSWIEYYECQDEFYSKFRYHERLKRSEKRYYTVKKPHTRTLGDFIVKKK